MSNAPLNFLSHLARCTAVLALVGAQGWAQSPPLRDAVRLHRPNALELAQREWEQCLAGGAQACTEADRLSLLVGFLFLSEGRPQEAVRQLESRAAPPDLRSIHAYYLGQARFYVRRHELAVKSFEQALAGAPSWLAPRIRARLGESLLAANQPKRALPLLEQAIKENLTPELLFQRAQAREAMGMKAQAAADHRLIAVKFPTHPHTDWVMHHAAPRFSVSERFQRARRLLDAGLPEAALAELDAVAPEGNAAGQFMLLRANALLALNRPDRAKQQLELAGKASPALAAEALMMEARQAMRQGDNPTARRLMSDLEGRHPREPAGPEAGFLAGWLAYQASDFEGCLSALEGFDARHPQSRRREEARWYRGLAFLRLGRHLDALRELNQLVRDFPKSPLLPQARYWSIRARQLEGKTTAEVLADQYLQLQTTHPGTFYALLAAERRRELGQPPAALFPAPKALQAEPPAELRFAIALAEAGLFRDANEEVQYRLSGARSTDKALRFGHALQSFGDYGHAHQLASRFLWRAVYGTRQPEALALMYPRAYQQSVEAYSAAHAVDPFFTWAIMRRESAFRPEVASAADARGLMQIIPPTAAQIAKHLATPAPQAAELFSPELNIRMGSWYLGALFQRFGHPALAAAAYNAGPSSVLRWMKEKGELPLDLFVEEIPYKETRGYVKQVLADYFIYQSLYGVPNSKDPLSFQLPAPTTQGVSF